MKAWRVGGVGISVRPAREAAQGDSKRPRRRHGRAAAAGGGGDEAGAQRRRSPVFNSLGHTCIAAVGDAPSRPIDSKSVALPDQRGSAADKLRRQKHPFLHPTMTQFRTPHPQGCGLLHL